MTATNHPRRLGLPARAEGPRQGKSCQAPAPILQFVVHGNPRPKERPRVVVRRDGNPHAYTPRATKNWERHVGWTARQAWTGPPLAGPVAIELRFYRANRRRADFDNLAKAVLDAIQGTALTDDDQVVEAHIYKAVDRDNPRVEVEIMEAEA